LQQIRVTAEMNVGANILRPEGLHHSMDQIAAIAWRKSAAGDRQFIRRKSMEDECLKWTVRLIPQR
jgi:hypothetical protein